MPYTKNGTCIPYTEDDVTIPDSFKIDYRKELLINVEVTPADTPDKTAQRIDTVIQKLSELIYFPDETFGDICIERFSLQGTIHITSGSFTDDAAGLTAISHVFSILASKPVEHTKIGLTRHYHSFFQMRGSGLFMELAAVFRVRYSNIRFSLKCRKERLFNLCTNHFNIMTPVGMLSL